MTITVGSHRFSEMDARRAVVHAVELAEGGGSGAATLRAELGGLTVGLDDVGVAPDGEALAALVAEIWPRLVGLHEVRSADGDLPDPGSGTVVHLARSGGGVPKAGADRVEIDWDGVEGDRQATRRHHGAPFQAVCLWSAEIVEGLAADGHPIAFGSAGENVTVRGLDWAAVQPGVRLRVGSALLQVMANAVPCSQLAGFFADRRFDRIHHSRGPVARMYAAVLEPGAVAVGDEVAPSG